MAFHLGKPILVMIILAGLALITSTLVHRGGTTRADLEMWVFSDQHRRTYDGTSIGNANTGDTPQRLFERQTGLTSSIKLVQYRALNTRLSTMFMAGTTWPDLPDVVEVEIGSVGRFFRPPVDEVGFLPLNDFIERRGWSDKIVKNRLAPWSKQGVVFGIPQDVHPVMIAYNDALFREAGVDLSTSQTWDEFTANCLRFQRHWRERGVERRWGLEMSESSAGVLLAMLLQRGINIVDDRDQLYLNDERVVDTLVRYCRMYAGPERIGASTAAGNQAFEQDLVSGYVGAMLCADWRLRYLREGATSLSGKMKVMPMPAWPDSPYRTSTIGGTMAGIPRNARDPEAAWKMIETLCLSEAGTREVMATSYVLPPITTMWDDPAIDAVDPYYSGQRVKQLVRELAGNVPPRYVSPASAVAEAELSLVMIDALAYMQEHGEQGLREHCRTLLTRKTAAVQRRIDHGSFDP